MANQKSMGETFQELREVLVSYAKQETVEPLNKLKHYLGWGIPGALVLSLGLYLISLGILRGLQHIEWTSSGFGSLLPYAVSLAFLIVVIGLNARKAQKSMSEGDDGSKAARS